MLDAFIAAQTGKIVSFDNVPANAGQAVQLAAAWCRHIGLPFQWANAADWWDGSDDIFLEYWDRIPNERHDAEQLPKPGDIIIFAAALPGSGGTGHASIFVRNVGPNSWEGFTSNWGGKSSHLQSHNWSYVLGWYTPKNRAVLEGAPTPIADEAPSMPYETTAHESVWIKVKESLTAIYDLTNVNWESFKDNPIHYLERDTKLLISTTAKHRLGGTYYMPDPTRAEGLRIGDCQELKPAAKKKPAVEPAVSVAKPTMQSPHYAPSTTDIIKIERKVPKYMRMSDALQRTNPAGGLEPADYFVFKRLNGVMIVAPRPGMATGDWINPADLEPEVVKPRDWRDSWTPFVDNDGILRPRYYAAIDEDMVVDLEAIHKDQPIFADQPILIAGWFQGPDEQWYGRPAAILEEGMFYGVRQDNLRRWQPQAAVEQATPVEIVNPPLRMRDKLYSVLQDTRLHRVFNVAKIKTYKER